MVSIAWSLSRGLREFRDGVVTQVVEAKSSGGTLHVMTLTTFSLDAAKLWAY